MPRQVDQAERRREISYAVWLLIATGGLEAVTMRAVAAEAGVSVGRIQHYFASKEELVHASCRTMIDQAETLYRASSDTTDPHTNLLAILTQAIPGTERARMATAVWYAYLAHSLSSPALATLLREAKEGETAEVALLVQAAQVEASGADAADPSAADPRAVARRLLALTDGLALRVFTGLISADEAVAVIRTELAADPWR